MDFLIENIDGIVVVIYCFIIGIVIAFAISLVTKSIYGRLVDALVRNLANSPDNAKTLDEIGIKKNFLLDSALSQKTLLSSLIKSDDGIRFYILPEKQKKAQSLFGTEKLSLWSIVIAVLLFAVIFILFHYAVPKFLN